MAEATGPGDAPAELATLDTTDTAQEVLALLDATGRTLACAESVTGGRCCDRLVGCLGAGDRLRGGVVAYHRDVKHQLLQVPSGPVVSQAAAEAMAEGVRPLLGADAGLAVTGVAGPEPQDGAAVGTVWVASAVGETLRSRHVHLAGDPEQIRDQAVEAALEHLHRHLRAHL